MEGSEHTIVKTDERSEFMKNYDHGDEGEKHVLWNGLVSARKCVENLAACKKPEIREVEKNWEK